MSNSFNNKGRQPAKSIRSAEPKSSRVKTLDTTLPNLSPANEVDIDVEREKVTALLEPGGLLRNMELLGKLDAKADKRHNATRTQVFEGIYRAGFVAKSSPGSLTEFLRHTFWDGRSKKPSQDDMEAILGALFKFHFRDKPKSSARSALHTSLSAARELLARNVMPRDVKAVLGNTVNGIAGLRDAFKDRKKAISATEGDDRGSKSKTAIHYPIILPFLWPEDLSYIKFNGGEMHLVVRDRGRILHIPQSDLDAARRRYLDAARRG